MNVAELLVHVSGKQQDERYRCMAKAYEDFEIERIVDLTAPKEIEDTTEDVTLTPTAFRRAGDDLPTDAPTPSLSVQPRPIPRYETPPPLFSNLSPLFPTAVFELDFTATGLPSAAEAKLSQEESQVHFITDTPLATKALESQLWTSSLALAHEEEARAFAAASLATPDHVEELERKEGDVDSRSSKKDTALEATSPAVPAIGQLDGAFDDGVHLRNSHPSSLKRKRCSDEHEAGSRRASGMSLTQEVFGLRPREASTSPAPPSPILAPTPQSEQDLPVAKLAALIEPVVSQNMAAHAQTTSVRVVHKELSITTSPQAIPVNQQSRVDGSQLRGTAKIQSVVVETKQSDTSTALPVKLTTPQSSRNIAVHTKPIAHDPATRPVVAPVARQAPFPPIAPVLSHPASHQFIRPASPPVSIAAAPQSASSSSQTLSPNITESLQHLYNKFSPVKPPRYLPIRQSRPLRPLERGYWYLPARSTTKTWDMRLLQDFWSFLEDFIMGGQAGWGISCVRVPIENNSAIDTKMDGEEEQRCDVRVYCWGEVVEHVYYLLFVASRSKVKNAGLKWIDGGGKVVLVMPAG